MRLEKTVVDMQQFNELHIAPVYLYFTLRSYSFLPKML